MHGDIKVSIITVVYNAAGTIRRAIDSVLSQTYPNLEYIIIDGGSTDGTVDIIREYAERLTHWVSEPDKGLYDAMNKGIGLASGDLIGIVNADDSLVENNVIALVAEAYKGDNILVVSDTIMVSPEREVLFTVKQPRRLYYQIPFLHTSCFIPRLCFERWGGYDLSYKIAADVDFLMRLFRHGVDYTKVPMPLVRMSMGGLSDRRFKYGRQEYRDIYIKHFKNPVLGYAGYIQSLLMHVL